jgi:dihydrofolate reductase
MIIISAMTHDRVIGAGEGMPWSVPAEYRHFLDTVRGNTVIMGRRSFEIFGPDLGESRVVMVSRSASSVEGAEVAGSIEGALEIARRHGAEIYSAGGASIYRQTIPLADTMLLSVIDGSYEGDTHFPAFDEGAWRLERREPREGYALTVYRRVV